MAIHDTGMFTVKEINRLKILQDVIDRNLRPGQAAEMDEDDMLNALKTLQSRSDEIFGTRK
ncbi:hypothetical protein YN18_001877 [Salmonella enterica subsp. enterica]|nr:hypothetical protein [Salmonella enterica subsp. enterica]ECD2823305.1 hypothetical protein [Salmonella enterica subsp. enterica serovar Fanti]EDR2887762.1 hypothetical protein [Salmonella enterica subsp. enterica]EDR6142560.1 hypothetical protein [Salmonella enterica subsp. enterica]EDU9860772.1 hypothetical protein [Salmonella enterica subsp. enterica]